jgi:hypothetical protein
VLESELPEQEYGWPLPEFVGFLLESAIGKTSMFQHFHKANCLARWLGKDNRLWQNSKLAREDEARDLFVPTVNGRVENHDTTY